ncbi:hypothetical protein HKX48_006493 [Thoreauomyces humboldtii]|nr:hypothetical protein HKX48_006493 [Thoreauomyces humboldtii]
MEPAPPSLSLPENLLSQTHRYGTVNGDVPLLVDLVLLRDLAIPNAFAPPLTKIICNFHGGALITSGRSFLSPACPRWLVPYTALARTVTLSFDYRLLPESRGADVLADVSTGWDWVQSTLPKLFPHLRLDLNNVVVTGASAGGFLAAHLGIAHPLTSVVAGYPMIDIESPHYTVPKTTVGYFGMPPAPRGPVDAHLAAMKPGHVVTEREGMEALELAVGMLQQGRLRRYLGRPEEFSPLRLIDQCAATGHAKAHAGQKWFVFAGKDDTVVPVQDSHRLVRRLDKLGAKVRYVEKSGEHFFDNDLQDEDRAALANGQWGEFEWLKEGLDWALSPTVGTSHL